MTEPPNTGETDPASLSSDCRSDHHLPEAELRQRKLDVIRQAIKNGTYDDAGDLLLDKALKRMLEHMEEGGSIGE